MRRIICAVALIFMLAPMTPALAVDLPKCRNVAGYEPKPTCEARNQRAQWQANQTAQITARLVADALARQSEADAANQKSFMDSVQGAFNSAVGTVSGFFD